MAFTKLEVTMENAMVGPWRLARKAKSPGVAAPVLYRDQEDSTTGETVAKAAVAPSHPPVSTIWASSTMGGQREAVSRLA